jgi:murein DD-endopeptidase MepM/ murein hydrolase activator NlpD
VSRVSARHRKPSRFSSARSGTTTRHRNPKPIASALLHKPAWAAATVAGSALIASAGLAAHHWTGETPRPAAIDNADPLRSQRASAHPDAPSSQQAGAGPMISNATAGFSRLRATEHAAKQQRRHTQAQPVYLNPLRGVNGLIPERVDMGVDFAGSGSVYALGDGVITNAMGNSAGWPGGGWITYRLTDGPDAGLMVYVAEDVTPTVQVGQQVTSATVIADMFAGGDGIETGWARPDGASAESQLPAAGGISGGGPFPTMIGLSEGSASHWACHGEQPRGSRSGGVLPGTIQPASARPGVIGSLSLIWGFHQVRAAPRSSRRWATRCLRPACVMLRRCRDRQCRQTVLEWGRSGADVRRAKRPISGTCWNAPPDVRPRSAVRVLGADRLERAEPKTPGAPPGGRAIAV